MLIQYISWAFTAYETLILIWAIMSWFPDARYSDLGRSAFAALAGLHLVRNFLLRLLIGV